jgi:MFS family permease
MAPAPNTTTGSVRDSRALRNWRNAIIAAFSLGGITVSAWGPRLPAIRSELHVGTGTIGLVLACGTVGSIGGLLASRTLLHWLGGRRAVMTSATVVALSLVIMSIGLSLHAVALLAIGFVVAGFGLGSLDVAINVEGSAVEREAGRTLLPVMHSAWSGGAALGSGIGAACAAAGISPAAQFLGIAAIVVIVGFVLTRAIPLELPAEEAQSPSEAWSVRIKRWLHGWTNRRLLLIGLVLVGVEFGEGAANNWLTLAVKQDHGRSGAIAALFLTLFAISEMASRVLGGPLVDRFGRVRVIRGTTALGALGVVLFIVGRSEWLVIIGTLLWAIGVSMGFPLGMSAAAEAGDDPAAQVSVTASLAYFSSLAGPPLIGFLAQSIGLLGALWLVAAFLLIAFAAAGSLRPPALRAR